MSVEDRLASLSPAQRALFAKLRGERRGPAASLSAPPPLTRVSGPDATGDWPLSFDQERLWILSRLDPEGSAFNLLAATRLTGTLHLPALAGALNAIVRRQAAWRTTFPAVDGVPIQRVAPAGPLPL
ncbi:MAG TPA: hypothetical protein DD490_00105, partial [Acidobacteria bacterium]|nr:hypothetical protein [Acidobacteriota bacterium]